MNSDIESTRRDIYLAFIGVILVYLVFGYAYTLTFDGQVDSIPDLIYDVQYLTEPVTVYSNF